MGAVGTEVHATSLMFILSDASGRCWEKRAIQKQGNFMGVMPRKSGEKFIITSDRVAGELPSNRVPKKTPLEVFQVWTGQGWSATITDATFFTDIDVADEYIRANYARVMA
jgi:hypothetical protein